MKKVWKRGAAFALAASVACSQNVMSSVYSADKNSDSVEWNTDAEVSVEYLTLQPGGDGFGCESELVCAGRNGESDCEIW